MSEIQDIAEGTKPYPIKEIHQINSKNSRNGTTDDVKFFLQRINIHC